MAGVTIDPSLAGFSSDIQQGQQAIPAGGVVIDPSMIATVQQEAQQGPRPEAPSGFVQGLGDPLFAVGQLVAKGLEQLPESAKLGGRPIAASARAFSERVVPERESAYQRARAAAGEEGFDAARLGGNVAAGIVPGMAISRGVSLVAPASRGIQAALSGGVGSALMTPVESATNFWENKAQQAGAGAALGYGLDKILGAAVSPAMTAAGQKLKDMGVKLTPGQAFGGMTQTIEDLLAKLPVTGSTVRSAQEKSIESFNNGVINQSLSKIGSELPKGTAGVNALEYLANKADDAFETVKPKVELGQTLNLFTGLRDVLSKSSSLKDEQSKYISNFISKKINGKFANGPISGNDFKSLDSELGEKASNYARGVGSDAEFADALYGLRQLLRNELRTVDPTDTKSLDQLKAANSVWADKLRIDRAASYLGSKNGIFTPDQLSAASKALDKTSNKSATALRTALMKPEAEAGSIAGIGNVISPTQGSSTAELGAGGLAGFGAAASGSLPLTAALPLAPMAFYTSPMQSLFNAVMTSGRPSFAPAVRQKIPAAISPGLTGGLLRDERIPRIELTGMAR